MNAPRLGVDEAQAAWAEVVELLGEETRASLGDAGMQRAIEAFPIGTEGEGVDERWLGLFQSWLFFDHADDGRTVAERLLARDDPPPPTGLAALVAVANAAPLSFHLVERVLEGDGVEAVDVFTGARRLVRDADLAESLPVGSLFFGRLVEVFGHTLADAYGTYRLPGEWAAPLTEAMLGELELELPLDPDVHRALGTALLILYAQAADAHLRQLEQPVDEG